MNKPLNQSQSSWKIPSHLKQWDGENQVYELATRDCAIVLYDISEIAMGFEYGRIAILTQKNSPVVVLDPPDFYAYADENTLFIDKDEHYCFFRRQFSLDEKAHSAWIIINLSNFQFAFFPAKNADAIISRIVENGPDDFLIIHREPQKPKIALRPSTLRWHNANEANELIHIFTNEIGQQPVKLLMPQSQSSWKIPAHLKQWDGENQVHELTTRDCAIVLYDIREIRMGFEYAKVSVLTNKTKPIVIFESPHVTAFFDDNVLFIDSAERYCFFRRQFCWDENEYPSWIIIDLLNFNFAFFPAKDAIISRIVENEPDDFLIVHREPQKPKIALRPSTLRWHNANEAGQLLQLFAGEIGQQP